MAETSDSATTVSDDTETGAVPGQQPTPPESEAPRYEDPSDRTAEKNTRTIVSEAVDKEQTMTQVNGDIGERQFSINNIVISFFNNA
ncbi:hypothetical protein PUN28_005007 [Cardiocondyla obscurior]|uniref:Uncharacterized protein n=1 Tax=Cardiocondyla obscurior TaxID=286306 RepID=A0AAW2GFB2_9HYME